MSLWKACIYRCQKNYIMITMLKTLHNFQAFKLGILTYTITLSLREAKVSWYSNTRSREHCVRQSINIERLHREAFKKDQKLISVSSVIFFFNWNFKFCKKWLITYKSAKTLRSQSFKSCKKLKTKLFTHFK